MSSSQQQAKTPASSSKKRAPKGPKAAKTAAKTAQSPMHFDAKDLDVATQKALYTELLWPRLIEEKMLRLLRQGRISKWFSGIGQEATAVGIAQALQPQDAILPLHRNLGIFTGRKLPLKRLFAQIAGKAEGYTQGRDRSFHFGAPEHNVIGMISHLGAMLGVADGIALGHRLQATDGIALAFSGDGGASEGDFHEAINVAAVWQLPVVFLVENNGYGLSTPSNEQFRCAQFIDKALGYGIEGIQIDGNNILDVYHTVQSIAAKMRQNPAPVLLETRTFRMRGHEEASGTRYVPQALMDKWAIKDPVINYERFLQEQGVLSQAECDALKETHKASIDEAWNSAEALPAVQAHTQRELAEVYAQGPDSQSPGFAALPTATEATKFTEGPTLNNAPQGPEVRLVDAISQGLHQGMQAEPKMVIMGQDVADYGGVFKITEGFVEAFGKDRVRNTPLCESAIVGASMGLALMGHPNVMEMQFSDFVSCGFNQIVNNLAKTHYRWGQPLNVTIRMPTGGGVGAGPFHSQSIEAWFAHVPGLKVVFPSTPGDAKGLLLASLQDPNPVLFFEHKQLYRSLVGPVPTEAYVLPLGKARIVAQGDAATVVTYGAGVHATLQALQSLGRSDVEVVDLRTLVPWDKETVLSSVRRTGRCMVVHEATQTCGFGAEIAAEVAEAAFEHLDAPVARHGSLDTPVPFNKALEADFLGQDRLVTKLADLLAY